MDKRFLHGDAGSPQWLGSVHLSAQPPAHGSIRRPGHRLRGMAVAAPNVRGPEEMAMGNDPIAL